MRGLLLIALACSGCQLLGTKSATFGTSSTSSGDGGGAGGNPSADPDATVSVPKLVGLTRDQANAALSSAGFMHGVDNYPLTCEDAKPAPGTIECQDPAPGASVKANASIKVSVLAAKNHTRITADDFASLAGIAVEQAKARAKQLGHTGKITVEESNTFYKDCKAATVCEATGLRGGSTNIAFEEDIVLYTNKTLTISAPD